MSTEPAPATRSHPVARRIVALVNPLAVVMSPGPIRASFAQIRNRETSTERIFRKVKL